MKNLKITALLISALLALTPAFGCSDSSSSDSSANYSVDRGNSSSDSGNGSDSSESQDRGSDENTAVNDSGSYGPIGSVEITAAPEETAVGNDTEFTLNSVYDTGVNESGMRYIYLDIDIRNNTDTEYSLSTLNNFYLLLPDGREIYSSVRTQLYAMNNFKDGLFSSDPYDIPANGEFKAIIGGFLLDEGINDFTVCFFPTQGASSNKENVIKVDITADNIKSVDELLK